MDGPYGYGHLSHPGVVDAGQSAWMDEPYAFFAGRQFRKGEAPLWNPYNGIGTPLLADMLSSTFYPLKIFVYTLSNPLGWDVFFLLRILLAGFFMYGFLKETGVSSLGSVTGSIGFMFSGPLTLWVNAFHLNADILIPLQFWLAELLLKKRETRFYLFNSIILTISILGGNPQPTILSICSVFLYYLMRRIQITAKNESVVKNTISCFFEWGGIVVIGLGLSCFQLLPFLEFFRLGPSVHSGAGMTAFPLSEIRGFIYPTIFRDEPNLSRLGIGCLLVSLAIMGFWNKKKFFPQNIFIAVIGLFFLLKYFGVFIVQWVGLLPIFDHLLFIKYAPPLIAFSASALAGIGLDVIRDNSNSRRLVLIANIAIVLMMFIIFPLKRSLLTSGGYWIIILSVFFSVFIIIYHRNETNCKKVLYFIPLIVFLELFIIKPENSARRYDPYTKPPYVDFLQKKTANERIFALDSILYLNTSAAFKIQNLGIIASIYESRFLGFCKVIDPAFLTRSEDAFRLGGQRTVGVYPGMCENRLMNLLGIKYFVSAYPIGTDSIYEKILQNGIDDRGLPLAYSRSWIRNFGADAPCVFFQHPPSKVMLPFRVPKDADKLEFACGLDPQVWNPNQGDGAGFKILVDEGNGPQTVFYKYVDPKNNVKDRQWYKNTVNLQKYRGREIKLIFMTDPGPNGDNRYDWAGWSNLTVYPVHNWSGKMVYEKAYDGEVKIYKNPNALPRAFVVHQTEEFTDHTKILTALMNPNMDMSKTAIIEDPAGKIESSNESSSNDEVKIILYQPKKIQLNVRTNSDGFLILSDLYYPGWQVYINKERKSLYRTNYLLRGVPIKKGESKMEFIYRPASFYLGVAISFFVFGLSLISLMFYNKKMLFRILISISAVLCILLAIHFSSQYRLQDVSQLIKTILTGKVPPVL